MPLALQALIAHLATIAVFSFATFVTYAIDKRRARSNGRRVRERTLHRMSWLGGAPGGWLGRQLLRHKTRKRAFALHLAGATTLHLVVAGVLVWLVQR